MHSEARHLGRWRATPEGERDNGKDKEHDEKDLRDTGGGAGESAKSKDCGDDRDNKEQKGPS